MKTSMGKIITSIFLVIFIGIFCVSAYFLYNELMVYKKGDDEYDKWVKTSVTSTDGNINNPLSRSIDFQELKKKNPDIKGWIYLPGTNIDYPVVQGPDNNKYLTTLFSGDINKAGAIFIDSNNKMDFKDDQTLIYGHNMRNKSMFNNLKMYVTGDAQNFYENHKIVYFYTETATYELRVLSACNIHANDIMPEINFGEHRDDAVNRIMKNSKIKTGLTVGAEDKIVALSTCAYEFNDARYVVYTVLHKIK